MATAETSYECFYANFRSASKYIVGYTLENPFKADYNSDQVLKMQSRVLVGQYYRIPLNVADLVNTISTVEKVQSKKNKESNRTETSQIHFLLIQFTQY